MKRIFLALALFALGAPALSTAARAETNVTLRARVEASGPAVTFGDLFTDAGDAAARAVAPAPEPGQVGALSAEFLVAAARTSGLIWTPPQGMTSVRVVRPGGARATIATPVSASSADGSMQAAAPAIRRGDTVLLVFVAPGMQLTTHARATQDGAVGAHIRLVNLQSNRAVDAVVTGPGAAAANVE